MAVDHETPASVLAVLRSEMQARADNLRNISSDNLKAQSVNYMDIPLRREHAGDTVNESSMPGLMLTGRVIEAYPDGNRQISGLIEGSTTYETSEIVHMLVTQRTIKANTQPAQAVDDMTGSLLKVKT